MQKEQYVQWEPLAGLPKVLYCDGLHDDFEFFRILLRGRESTDPVLRILFVDPPAYRNMNESYRLRTWSELRSSSGWEGGQWSLFKVNNSAWMNEVREESMGILIEDVEHYAVITPEDCIDVLSAEEPVVEWLDR